MMSSSYGLFLTAAIIALSASGCYHFLDGHTDSHGQHAQHAEAHTQQDVEQSTASFTAKHIKKRATITLHGDINTVWPLFDPINESKWAQEWQPDILHPADGAVQEGMVFRTHGELVWMITRYEPDNHHITYTVNNPEKMFTVDVQCKKHGGNLTEATITYNYVGLTALGNKSIEHSAEQLFKSGLKDWQVMINHYLETGQAMDNPHGQHSDHVDKHP